MFNCRYIFRSFTLALLAGNPLWAQPVVTLDDCYAAAVTAFRFPGQTDLVRQSGEVSQANLGMTRRLPQLALNGQATWQSDVTGLAIDLPNFTIPRVSKDQYKLTLDASYTLFDGGLLALQQQTQQLGTALESQRIEVAKNQLKDQVNALYLNALLTDENIRLTSALRKDIADRIGKVQAGIKFGTASPLNADVLEAELLKTDQRLAELGTSRRGLRDALALLTSLPITEATQLATPVVPTESLPLQRPETRLYDLQRQLTEAQQQQANNRRMPRLSAFAQPGYGRPGLNLLDNSFRGFFIGGLRLNWNLSNTYTLKNDQRQLAISRQQIDNQQATFNRNLTVQLRQQQTEVDRLTSLLADDSRIVALRSKIRKTAAVQLDNGVIAARDYLTELNAENQAQLNQTLHELRLLLARVNYRTLIGQ